MQAKFKVEHGAEQINQDEKATSTFEETIRRLNIIDMTGTKTQVLTASSLQLPGEKKQSSLLLKKILKIKDEAKFNVKALV